MPQTPINDNGQCPFKYNDIVRQINPCPWISNGVYYPSKSTWTRHDLQVSEFIRNNKVDVLSAQDHTFRFKSQSNQNPTMSVVEGEATGNLYRFRIDSIILA